MKDLKEKLLAKINEEKEPMKEKVDLRGLDNFVKVIADMTDRNEHGKSLEMIAKFFKLDYFSNIFTGINMISDAERHLPNELSKYRYSKYKDMFEIIKRNFGEEVYSKVYGAT
jgi:hypothetical protein